MGLPVIDWNVSVGNLLQIVIIVGGGLWVFAQLRADMKVLVHDMGAMKQRQDDLGEAFKQLGAILTKVAVQDERLNQMAKSIDELRHGESFVFPLGGKSIP